MKIIQKSSKKAILISVAVGIIILVGGLSYYVLAMDGVLFGWRAQPEDSASKDSKSDAKPVVKNQQQSEQDAKQQTVEKTKKEKSDDTPATKLSVAFTSVVQSGSTLRVRAMIQSVVSGSCTLKLTKAGQTVTKTAETYPSASITTCQGFDIPISELSAGTWNLALTITTDNATGTTTSTTNIEK